MFDSIMMTLRIAVIILTFSLVSCTQPPELQDGDIIFHRSQSKQSKAIALATHSHYTHMGLVFFDNGKPFVYEAIQPVTRTPLSDWIGRGENKHYVVRRLKDISLLDSKRMKQEVSSMIGKDYDWLFEWSDKRIYCSELVWKAYEKSTGLHLGSLRTLGDFDLEHVVVKQLMKERYGKNIPLQMNVIAPSDIFDSPLLMTVSD